MTCPICGKPSQHSSRPFCSRRCADLDLARWFDGSYAMPSNDPEDLDALEDLDGETESSSNPPKPH